MRSYLLAAILTLGMTSAAEAANIYVDASSPNTPGTGTEVDPYRTIDSAIAHAGIADGDEIRVADGSYTLSATRTIPVGVTVRGGYVGGGAGGWADGTDDPAVNTTTITYNGTAFYLSRKSVVEGVTINSSSSAYLIYLNGSGAIVRNAIISDPSEYVFRVQATGVTVETSTITTNGCGYTLYMSGGSYHVTFRNNTVNAQSLCNRKFYLNNGHAILSGNTFNVDDDSWDTYVYFNNAHGHVYKNVFNGYGGDKNGAAIEAQDGHVVVEYNNITGFYNAFESEAYNEEGLNYVYFRNNVVWNNTGTQYGFIEIEQHPYDRTFIQNNCMDDGPFYLYSYMGQERFASSIADLQSINPANFSGNAALATPPATLGGAACTNKGAGTTTSIATKPVAYAYAEDQTGSTDRKDISVHPGMDVWLRGDDSLAMAGGPLTYTWTQIGGATVTLDTTGNDYERTFIPATAGLYTFRLTVTDKNGQTATDTVRVTVNARITVLRSNGTTRGTYTTIQRAIDAAQSGDTIQFPAGYWLMGDDWEDRAEVYGKSNLTIQGAGSGSNGTLIGLRCNYDGFEIGGSNNITIRDMAFVDADDCWYYAADIWDSSDIVIDNIAVSNKGLDPWGGYGVYSSFANVDVRNSRFEWLYEPVGLDNCGVYNVTGNEFTAIYEYALYGYYNTCGYDRFTITDNTFDMKQTSSEVIYLYDGYASAGPWVIARNQILNAYYYGIELDYIYYGIVQIHDNLLANDTRWIWQTWTGIDSNYASAEIKNNIIRGWGVGNGYPGAYIDGSDNNEVAFIGNVISDNGGYGIENYMDNCSGDCYPLTWASQNVLYNNGYGPYYYVDVRDGNIYADPKFRNPDAGDFSLLSGSPVAEMGIGSSAKPAAPTGLAGEPLDGAVRVTFNEVGGASGYRVYWGSSAGSYPQQLNLGRERVATISGLAEMPYYFAVAAYNANGTGIRSEAIVVTPYPAAVTPQSEPEVHGVNPHRVYARPTEITILGTGFAEGVTAYAGAVTLEVIEVTPTMIKAKTTKALKPGLYPVVVINADLGEGALPQAITVIRNPAAEDTGCAAGGNPTADLRWMWFLLPLAWFRLRRSLRG